MQKIIWVSPSQQFLRQSVRHLKTIKTLTINEIGHKAVKLLYDAIFWACIIAIPVGLFLMFRLG